MKSDVLDSICNLGASRTQNELALWEAWNGNLLPLCLKE